MTVSECFICPVCGNNKVVLDSAHALLSDVRIDTMTCNKCAAEWRIYSRISEIQTEILKYPQEQSTPVEEIVEKDVSQEC